MCPKDNLLVFVLVFPIVHAEVAYDKGFGLNGLQGFPDNFSQNGSFSGLWVLILGSNVALASHFYQLIFQKYFLISNFRQNSAYFQGVPVVRQLFSEYEEVPL